MIGVYAIRNIKNGHAYVGSSVRLRFRWTRHRCDLRHDRHHSVRLQAAWDKHGEQSFEFTVLEEVATPGELYEREAHWIEELSAFRNGYNVKSTPNGFAPVTDETRAKMSIARMGRSLSHETRQRMSDAHCGKIISEAQRLAVSKAQKGVPKGPMSQITKDRISATRKRMFAECRL